MGLMLSMVLCREVPKISPKHVCGTLAKTWSDLPAATEVSEEAETFGFVLGGANVAIAVMPAPMPWSDLEGPCATSILWKNAEAEIKPHKAHVLVTVFGEFTPLELSGLLMKVTVAVMAATPAALGVYWGNATLIVPKKIFTEFAIEILPHVPPIEVWIDFRVGMNDDGKSAAGFTTGMKALGLMELEAIASSEPPAELHQRLTGLARYLLENGPVIKDRDTIGEDEHERIRVVYSDSKFGHEEKVMRLVYERPSNKPRPDGKPWWKFW